MEHFSPMNWRLCFHLPLDDKATRRLCSCPRLCLFWTSPLSHVKQWFVHSNETPTVMITFPVCHTDPPCCCLFWLYWDNGLLCLIRVPGSGSTPFSLSPFFSFRIPPTPRSLPLPAPCWGGGDGDTDTAQLISSNYCRNKESALPWTTICSTPEGVGVEEGDEGVIDWRGSKRERERERQEGNNIQSHFLEKLIYI